VISCPSRMMLLLCSADAATNTTAFFILRPWLNDRLRIVLPEPGMETHLAHQHICTTSTVLQFAATKSLSRAQLTTGTQCANSASGLPDCGICAMLEVTGFSQISHENSWIESHTFGTAQKGFMNIGKCLCSTVYRDSVGVPPGSQSHPLNTILTSIRQETLIIHHTYPRSVPRSVVGDNEIQFVG
jgi:hypothetical protein